MSPANRSGNSRSHHQYSRSRSRRGIPAGFSFISGWVKYTMFLFNFLFWLIGALLIAIGSYAMYDKWTTGEGFKLENVFDVILNIAFLITIVGGVISIVSFAGCIGALRENMCLLRFYSICLLLFFLMEMALAALGFIFPHKMSSFLEGTLSDELIKNYRDDIDFQNFIDLLQSEFNCCGISSKGFRDWSKNEYFNCTKNPKDNPSVERCGVPFSCCLPDEGLANLMCGFGVQELSDTEAVLKVNTLGCIQILQGLVEKNLYVIGAIAFGLALIQLFVIWLGRTLERQIESQRALWNYT